MPGKAIKRILLIEPPFYRLMGSHYNGLNLGICYIAAVLKEHGYQVGVYNADYEENTEYLDQIQLIENFNLYKQILKDPSHRIWHEIKENISDFAPDLLGISMKTAHYMSAIKIARIAKSLNKDIKVVVGGNHPTIDPAETMAENSFDYVIRSEGEFSMLELANGEPEEGIKGLSFRKNGDIIHNEARPFIKDLDIVPFPSRDSFIHPTRYLDMGYVMTGRGCPFTCSFCASLQIWHRSTRYRSVANVISELEFLKQKLNCSKVHFQDDTLTMKRTRAIEIFHQMIDRHLDMKWICETRVDCLDKELVPLMKKAGCIRIKIGVESGSDRILKDTNKGITTEQIKRAVCFIREAGIPFTAHLMIGFPGETNDDVRQTIDFARGLHADYYSLSVLAPYYGTKVWKDLEKEGKKPDREHWEYFFHQNKDMLVNSRLDPSIVKEFFALNEITRGNRL